MRSYIFTKYERELVKQTLEGKPVKGVAISKLKYRIKTFNRLREDVYLYLKMCRKLGFKVKRV